MLPSVWTAAGPRSSFRTVKTSGNIFIVRTFNWANDINVFSFSKNVIKQFLLAKQFNILPSYFCFFYLLFH